MRTSHRDEYGYCDVSLSGGHMTAIARTTLATIVTVAVHLSASIVSAQTIDIQSRFAEANGIRLHYLVAGSGEPVLLLHGFAETSHMWRPLILELAKTRMVIAPDLRGFDQSAKPEGGYRQEDDGAGRSCADGLARPEADHRHRT